MARKRAKGEGSIRKRTDGRWEVTIMVGFNDNGKPKRHSVYGKTQKEAIDNATAFRQQLERGQVIDKRLTLGEYAEQWYIDYEDQVRPSTYEGYKYTTLRVIIKLWGKKRLYEMKAADVERGLKKLVNEGSSRSVVTKVKAMLHQILRKAEANGQIDKNPVPLTQKTRMKDKPRSKDSFSLTEVGKLFQELPDTRIGHAIRLSIACGMRSQELLALTPEHIDLENGVLHIEQAVYLLKGTVNIGEPKSAAGTRTIPIPPIAIESAEFLRNTDDEFIMQGETDMPINPTTYRDHYKAAISQVEGVRHLLPHCTRHTYITLMQASGVSIETIQTLAGHSDRDTTFGYMHIKDEVTFQAAQALSTTLEFATKK